MWMLMKSIGSFAQWPVQQCRTRCTSSEPLEEEGEPKPPYCKDFYYNFPVSCVRSSKSVSVLMILIIMGFNFTSDGKLAPYDDVLEKTIMGSCAAGLLDAIIGAAPGHYHTDGFLEALESFYAWMSLLCSFLYFNFWASVAASILLTAGGFYDADVGFQFQRAHRMPFALGSIISSSVDQHSKKEEKWLKTIWRFLLRFVQIISAANIVFVTPYRFIPYLEANLITIALIYGLARAAMALMRNLAEMSFGFSAGGAALHHSTIFFVTRLENSLAAFELAFTQVFFIVQAINDIRSASLDNYKPDSAIFSFPIAFIFGCFASYDNGRLQKTSYAKVGEIRAAVYKLTEADAKEVESNLQHELTHYNPPKPRYNCCATLFRSFAAERQITNDSPRPGRHASV